MIKIDKKSVVYRGYDNISFLYDLKTKKIMRLSKVALDIIDFLFNKGAAHLDEIINHITTSYNIDKQTAKKDINSFLRALSDSKIILNSDKIPIHKSENVRIKTNENIEDFIIKYCTEHDIIFSATMELTYSCNEKCIHCYAHYKENSNFEMLSFEKIQEILDELHEMGCVYISFTGGDPFMHPDFMKIFKYAREKGFICNIYTNAQFLYSHQNLITDLIEYNVNAFYISIYGSTDKIHEEITQTKHSLEKTVFVINKIKDFGGDVIANIMALKNNAFDVENIVKKLKKENIPYRIDMSVAPRNDGNKVPQTLFISDEKIIHNIHKLSMENDYFKNRFGDTKYMINSEDSDYICGAGITNFSITPDGTVFPCVSLKIPLGNVHNSNLNEIWNGPHRKKIKEMLKRKYLKDCSQCHLSKACSFCPALSLSESGSMHSCNFINKTIASGFLLNY